jgi:uncharacterized protein (TIGR02266 family)
MGDRREYPRLALALAAQYRAESSVLGRRATISDLSAKGVAFVAEEPLEPGTRLHYLRFTIGTEPATHTLRPGAVVVRCERQPGVGRSQEFLIGAQLEDLASAELEIIERFVAERLECTGEPDRARIELEQPVAVRFDRFDEFVTEVSKNLSRTGMFIRSERPQPTGSTFDFCLQLGDDFKLVQGRAQVVWTRAKSEGRELPPGMGIRFLDLDGSSENVLRRLIRAHTQAEMPRALAVPTAASGGSANETEPTRC